jgi:DNA-binding IscR family transcriptional regulator
MRDIIRALDGSTAPMECLPNPSVCQLAPGCAIRGVWQEVENFTEQLLLSTTLDQLAERHQVTAESKELMYYI